MRCSDLFQLGRARWLNMTKHLDDGLGQAAQINQLPIRPCDRCYCAR